MIRKSYLFLVISILLVSTQILTINRLAAGYEFDNSSYGFEFPDPQGPRPLLVVLLEFADNKSVHEPSVIKNEMFGPRPSMNDYWKETSYGNFYFIDNGVWKWIEAWDDPSTPENESSQVYWDGLSDYGGGKFRWWGIKSLYESENFNFMKFDNDSNGIIHLGSEVSYLIVDSRTMKGGSDRSLFDNDEGKIANWTVNSNDLKIGNIKFTGTGAVAHGGEIASENPFLVIAHELAHNAFGFADYYADGIKPENIKMYSLMGDYYGPHHLDAYSKFKLGWIRPTVVMSDGYYTIPDSETNPVALILHDPDHGTDEYFLVENRYMGNSYDNMTQFLNNTRKNIRDEGLIIWHVDETRNWRVVTTGGISKVQLLTMDGNFGAINDYAQSAFDGYDPDYYDLNDTSQPRNTRWWNGQLSGIGIYAVSESKKYMQVYFDIPGSVGIRSWIDELDLLINPSGYAIYKLNVANTGATQHTVNISVEDLNSNLVSSIASSNYLINAAETRIFNIVVTDPNLNCQTIPELFNFKIITESTTNRIFKQVHYASLNTSFVNQTGNLDSIENVVYPLNFAKFEIFYSNGGNTDGHLDVKFESLTNHNAKAEVKKIPSSWLWLFDEQPRVIEKCFGNNVSDYFRIFVPEDWAGLSDTLYEFNIITTSQFGYEVITKGNLTVKATPESMFTYHLNTMRQTIKDSKYQSLRVLLQNAVDKTEFAMLKYTVGNLRLAKNNLNTAQNEIMAYKNEINALSGKIIDYKVGMMMVYEAEKLISELEQTKTSIFMDVIIGRPNPPTGGK